ncbi:HET domain-containing protein [Fusarium sp. LHS14.1]|nr:HET domain-containing protein [Fusarium sp. LHS14.1]
MRLIKVASVDSPRGLEMVDFSPNNVPPYAILSHTWTDDEVIYTDVINNTAKQKSSYHKVEYTCRQAIADGYEYAWADNCCIDKRSSAELSEAINSMFEWYSKAERCYAYLTDCPGDVDTTTLDSKFTGSRWFTRGWTLQELVAPQDLIFYGQNWVRIGEKRIMSQILSSITGIDEDILINIRPIHSASVAKRMSWAASRETTRPEDVAYSLMGLFNVNMPMLYGEGDRAFLRLQEEIMKQSDDQSIFAWTDRDAPSDAHHGLLAKSPTNFKYSNSVVPYEDWEPRTPYSMSNRGLRIDLHLTRQDGDIFVAAIDCPSPKDYENNSFLALYLRKVSDGDEQYARIRVGQFAQVNERGNLRSIYVRQDAQPSPVEGVFPTHVLQLRKGPDPTVYGVTRILSSPGNVPGEVEAVTSSRASPRTWLSRKWTTTYRLNKAAAQASVGIVFRRDDKERLLVMLGSAPGLKVAFHAVELPMSVTLEGEEKGITPAFEQMQPLFRPKLCGEHILLDYHRIRVDAQPMVHKSSKYYLIDIQIEVVSESSRFLEAWEAIKRAERAMQAGIEAKNMEQQELKHSDKKGWRKLLSR